MFLSPMNGLSTNGTCGTISISCLRLSGLTFQNSLIFLGHSGMAVRSRHIDASLVSSPGLFGILRALVRPRQHAIRVAFIVGRGQITLERFDQLRLIAGLFVLFRQPE